MATIQDEARVRQIIRYNMAGTTEIAIHAFVETYSSIREQRYGFAQRSKSVSLEHR